MLKMRIITLAEGLHKPIIRNFKERKVHSSFIDNIGELILLIYH